MMTLAEKFRNEGLELGLMEGIEFSVGIKLGDFDTYKSIIAKIRNIRDINQLKALKGKIKSAKTVPELIQFYMKHQSPKDHSTPLASHSL